MLPLTVRAAGLFPPLALVPVLREANLEAPVPFPLPDLESTTNHFKVGKENAKKRERERAFAARKEMDFWKDGSNQENNFCPGTVCACQTLNFDEEVIWARKNLGYAGRRSKITSHTAQEKSNAGKRFYDEGYSEGKHGVTDFARSVGSQYMQRGIRE